MTSLPTALSSSGGGGKVVLVGVRLHQPNANLLWGGGSSSSSGGGAAISREGQALVEFTLARLVVPGDRIVAMAVRIVRAPHTSEQDGEEEVRGVEGRARHGFNSEQDGEEEEDASQRMLAALHPKIEVAAAKQITLQVVVRSAPRVRDALLYEAKLLKAGLVVIGPVRRTITLIGAGSDVDMMTFLADRLSASCKIMLVSNNACSATRQGRFADVATMMRLRKVPVPPTSPQSPRIDPGGGGGGSGMGEGGGGSGLGGGGAGQGSGEYGGGSDGGGGVPNGGGSRGAMGGGMGGGMGEGGLWGEGEGTVVGAGSNVPDLPDPNPTARISSPLPHPQSLLPRPTEIIREVYGQDEYGQQEFYLDELLLATDNFSPQRLIGEGGSGQVFVGMLPPGRCPQVESQGGGSEGWGRGDGGRAEQGGTQQGGAQGGGAAVVRPVGVVGRLLRRIRHPSLLGLLGVCATARELLMVFDFLPNGSLQTRLRGSLRVLRRIRHPSLLGPLGVCAMAGDFLMVFDVLPNGSLQTRLRGKVSGGKHGAVGSMGRWEAWGGGKHGAVSVDAGSENPCSPPVRVADHTKPPLPWDLRMRIACEAATGLAFLHSCRPPIIHRDVKAANVLLDANMHALVSDFGLAKVASDQYTQPMAVTSIMGTRGYVAPEYVQTGLITAAIDVYAFGVILLELITGHVPFHPGRQPPNLSAWAIPIANNEEFRAIPIANNEEGLGTTAIPIANNEEFTRLVDYRLEGRYDLAQLQAVSMLAVLCLAANPKHRPPMDQVRLVHRAGRGIERLDPAQLQAVSHAVMCPASNPKFRLSMVQHRPSMDQVNRMCGEQVCRVASGLDSYPWGVGLAIG
ncbi:unnamed protein product [Closterium sp. NIES-65]|nr:unnamed protein product [Closterium sp. NIES-65]